MAAHSGRHIIGIGNVGTAQRVEFGWQHPGYSLTVSQRTQAAAANIAAKAFCGVGHERGRIGGRSVMITLSIVII